MEVPCKPEDMECRFLDHRQAHLHYSRGCEDCSSFTSLGWLPGILVLNTSHLYPHHPQTYAPLPAPLPRGPLPYPGLYARKMPPTTPMMSPTQHTFAFTPGPCTPPGLESINMTPGQSDISNEGKERQREQLGPQTGNPIPIDFLERSQCCCLAQCE